jgi:hypothetical protein
MPRDAQAEETDKYEDAVDQAIAACRGDVRAAVKALLIVNEFLEQEFEQLSAQVSKGYSRGGGAARRAPPAA